MDGRYGDLRAGAEAIAEHFPPDGDFAGLTVDDVHQLLKKIEPVFFNAEVGYARRLANAKRFKGQRKPFQKKGSASGGEFGEGIVVDHRTEGAKKMWEYFTFTGSGKASRPLRWDNREDAEWRPMSREPLRAIKPHLIGFANDKGFPAGRRSTRFYEEDILLSLDQLTHLKRLCLLVSQFFWPLFDESHWMKD